MPLQRVNYVEIAILRDLGQTRRIRTGRRARRAGIATLVSTVRRIRRPRADSTTNWRVLDACSAGLVIALAGYMRILGSATVTAYRGRMLNIHPSLLPRYRGRHTHRRAR